MCSEKKISLEKSKAETLIQAPLPPPHALRKSADLKNVEVMKPQQIFKIVTINVLFILTEGEGGVKTMKS